MGDNRWGARTLRLTARAIVIILLFKMTPYDPRMSDPRVSLRT
jgi:hypothetical protein